MIRTQKDLDKALDRTHAFPVEIDTRGPIPQKAPYKPIQGVDKAGFSFTTRKLLHAIGCKTAALPMNAQDECLRSAHLYVHIFDLEANPLCFKSGIDSDLQNSRSMETGIGMMCLVASEYWQIKWDALESIPGRGKRFDYRGKRRGLKAIFEAKGTKYRNHQPAQVTHGLEKKKAHHKRNEHYGVELIVSTHVGMKGGKPRILIADPEEAFGELAFANQYDVFYRYRHYARVMQFIGATRLARRFYLRSTAMLGFNQPPPEPSPSDIPQMSHVEAGGQTYLGNWYDTWVPDHSERYGHLLARQEGFAQYMGRFRVFQGILGERLQAIAIGGLDAEQKDDGWSSQTIATTQGVRLSVFPDGSALGIELKEE